MTDKLNAMWKACIPWWFTDDWRTSDTLLKVKVNSEQHRTTDCNRKTKTLACFEEEEEAEVAGGNFKVFSV